MKRLLLYFSYIGTNYKGIQRLTKKRAGVDLSSVQGVLEFGLDKLLRVPTSIKISSRTDTGVHALETTAHCDVLEGVFTGSPNTLCEDLNKFLETAGTDIRLKRIVEVDQDFHCRFSAVSRSYCYRLAVCKEGEPLNHVSPSIIHTCGALPIRELYRCQAIPQPFNPKVVAEVCSLFLGTWDFRSFMMTSKETSAEDYPVESFVKTLHRISLSQVHDRTSQSSFDPVYDRFDFYELNFESSGFLRRQVRRMVGALISVGRGDISGDDILFMLQNPGEKSWIRKCQVARADGLFLKSVNYENVPIVKGTFF